MAEIRHCKNCSRPIDIPPQALHKHFCSERCRNAYHNARTRRAKELLAAAEQKDSGDEL